MKSQRRHDLQTNELADAIGRVIARIRPHAQTVAVIAAAAVVAIAVLVALPVMRGRAAADAAQAFNQTVRAGTAESLRMFLDAYPDADQADAARVLLADRLVQNVAVGKVEDATATLEEAEAFYTQARKPSEALDAMAEVGLALVTLQRGDLDAGRKALEKVAETWPQSLAAAKAKTHLDALAGYKPVAFSDEPVEPPAAPESAPEGAEDVGAAGETDAAPAAAPAEAPAEQADGAPAGTGEESPAGKADGVPAETAEESPKPAG